MVYLDDILIYRKTLDEYIEHVKYALKQLRVCKLFAKSNKSEFCISKIEYLGHYVEDGYLIADEQKVAAVAEWPAPKTVKEL